MAEYNVTKEGDVFNVKTGRKLKPRYHNGGYLKVILNKMDVYIHREVAKKYLPNPLNLPQVNHKDGNKHNNHVDNLEWCDQLYNMKHAWENNLMKPHGSIGNENGRAILTEKQVLEIRAKYIPHKYTISRLSQEYGVSYGTIQAILLKKIWTHI